MVPQYCEGIANAVSQKDEKLHTAWLDDTAKPHIKKNTEILLEKNSIPQLFNTVNPHPPPPLQKKQTNKTKQSSHFLPVYFGLKMT